MIDKRPVERWGAFFGGVDDDADTRQSDVIAWMVIGLPSQTARLARSFNIAPSKIDQHPTKACAVTTLIRNIRMEPIIITLLIILVLTCAFIAEGLLGARTAQKKSYNRKMKFLYDSGRGTICHL